MSKYLEVNAGGGLVTDSGERCLLILRNGIWDLPKGHQDPEESIEDTAIREVCEETGLDSLSIDRFLCTTEHTYSRAGQMYLKHTWWCLMSYTGNTSLTPQTEEDITEVKWVSKSELSGYLQDTYPTIIEVFKSAGML